MVLSVGLVEKEHLFNRPSSRSLYTGTYACYLSHIKAIETALSDGSDSEYIVIIEDDADFSTSNVFDFVDKVDSFSKIISTNKAK